MVQVPVSPWPVVTVAGLRTARRSLVAGPMELRRLSGGCLSWLSGLWCPQEDRSGEAGDTANSQSPTIWWRRQWTGRSATPMSGRQARSLIVHRGRMIMNAA